MSDASDDGDLRKEAEDIAAGVRQQFLLLIGAGVSMLLVLNVTNVRLILGNDEITLPVIDVPTTISVLILVGPFVIAVLVIYMHLLLERLHELKCQGIRPPQIYFFTIQNTFSRAASLLCLYLFPPALLWWFFLRTTFRPEAGTLLALACVTLLVCSFTMMHRAARTAHAWERHAAKGFFGLSVVCVLGATGAFVFYGTGPFLFVTARITDFGLEGADLSVAADEVSFARFNFDGQCLRNAKLTGLDFSGASFAGADLVGADLSGADLREADLERADLSGANLSGADLAGAKMTDARLLRASAAGATFDGAVFEGARLDGADLTGASLLRVDARGAGFRQAVLDNVRASGADLDCADLREVSARTALFQQVTSAAGADFTDATLTGARFVASDLDGADFTRADMSGANVGGASMKETVLDGAILDGVNLDKASARVPAPAGASPAACQPVRREPPPSPCS